MAHLTLIFALLLSVPGSGMRALWEHDEIPDIEIGKPCKGDWNFVTHQGTCRQKNLKCYGQKAGHVDFATHAGMNEPGKCFVARKKVCTQTISGDESSGGCRGGTVCRIFQYIIYSSDSAKYSKQTQSYCIDPHKAEDNKLSFVEGNIVFGTVQVTSQEIESQEVPDFSEIGNTCKGGLPFDLYRGTCLRDSLKCYKTADTLEHADFGRPGKCFIAHRKECTQQTSNVFNNIFGGQSKKESSGGCRGGTVCRRFQYTTYSRKGDSYGKNDKSYCINPNSAEDAELSFVSSVVVSSISVVSGS